MHASRRIGRGNWSNYVVGIGIFGILFYSNGGRIPIPGIWGLIEGHLGQVGLTIGQEYGKKTSEISPRVEECG